MASKKLFFLLVLALILAVTNTVVSIWKLNQFETTSFLTGAAISSGTGQANLTITATTSLTNQNANINFGSGRINQSCNFCEININNYVVDLFSNGSNISRNYTQVAYGLGTDRSNCCVGFTFPTAAFLLENTGNVNVSVGYTCSGNCTHNLFIGGTLAPGMFPIGFQINPNSLMIQSGEDGGLDAAASCQGGGTLFRDLGYNVTNSSSYLAGTQNKAAGVLSTAGHWLCGNQSNYPLMPNNDKDAFTLNWNITIPADAKVTGVESSFTITFNGTSGG